jgi:FkbM family methyltransferase
MRIPGMGAIRRRLNSRPLGDPDRFLRHVSGVIHVGANTGQERKRYEKRSLRVIWIEPVPEIFERLKTNLRCHPRQVAIQYLVTDQDNAEYAFHIANNGGESSSILDFKLHKDIWPHVEWDRTIRIRSVTLPTLLRKENVNLSDYDALIMDTQGSELLVLKGAAPILREFRFIKTEVHDFECYSGCCQLKELDHFLRQYDFEEISRHTFAKRANGGSCYDLVYERKD